MRTFEHFPENHPCPICNTNEDKPCILIPIDGTGHNNIEEALVIHVDCINLRVNNNQMGIKYLFYQIVEKGE